MSKVIVRTFAYNAEKTIERTIQSLLNQTHQDFIWYVVDNGSTDSTGEILQQYAKKDERIVVIKNEKNRADTEYTIGIFYDILNKHDDSCYFCTLDADDCYLPHFFEKMLQFIEKNNLDIAVCASFFKKESDDQIVGMRKLQKELIIDNSLKAELLPTYYQFMRTIWGKMFSFATLRKCNFEGIKDISYGNDTYFSTEAFRNAKRIGISDEILHVYYMHERSISKLICDEKRINSPGILLEQGVEYLEEYGDVDSNNIWFLLQVYNHSMNDTILVALNTQHTPKEKLDICHAVLMEKYAKTAISKMSKDMISTLQERFMDWLSNNEMNFCVENRKTIKDILKVLGIETSIATCIYNNASDKFEFHLKCFESSHDDLEQQVLLCQIQVLLAGNNIANMFPQTLWLKCKNIIVLLLDENYEKALQVLMQLLEDEIFQEEECEKCIRIGQYLAASIDQQEGFLYLKKQMIHSLITQQKFEEAKEELDDYDLLLPQDEEFANFRKMLS